VGVGLKVGLGVDSPLGISMEIFFFQELLLYDIFFNNTHGLIQLKIIKNN